MKRLLKIRALVVGIVLPCFMVWLGACGSSGGSSSGSTPIPEDYSELVSTTNTQSKTLGTDAKDFAQKFNAFNEFDPTTASGSAKMTPINEMLDAAEVFEASLNSYNALIEAYDSKIQAAKGLSPAKQSVDALLVSDIADLISAGKTDAEAIQEMINRGEDENDIHAAINAYKLKHTGSAFRTGVTAIVGSGAGAIAGLTAATAGAPVLIVTGITIGTGIVVGAIWSWCTSSSGKSLKEDSSVGDTCSIAAVDGTTVELPDGSMGVAITLPKGGPGNLCMHIDGKAPLCVETTVDETGNTVVASCFATGTDDTEADAVTCSDDTTVADGIAITGADCATDVTSVNASATVSGGATVTIQTSLPTAGCSISYSLVGTDDYTQAATITTGADGTVSFTVPAGDDGVHDSVSITATQSGTSTSIGYTF